MTDSKTIVPKMPAEILTEAHAMLDRFIQDIWSDGYHQGYGRAEDAAIARIIQAVRPSSNERAAGNEPAEQISANVPGAETHNLIATVFRESASGKATPMQIFKSPANKGRSISRTRIGKALRRGEASGRYINDGNGSYSLGKTEA